MIYTVSQLAKMAGISIRTLHYYDEVGLLKPSYVKANGYRCYEENKLLRLQQILFFRELEFPLDKIRQIMQDPTFDPLKVLSDQKQLLELKKRKIEKLVTTIQQTMQSMKGGEYMSNNDTFSAFNDLAYQKYKDEVEKKWGNTHAYKQSMDRVGKMSKEDLERTKAEMEDISRSAAELMTQGFSFDSPEVQKQVDRFYTYLHHFYHPSYAMFRGLGQMYVDDPRFTKVYEKRAKGFSKFMRDAMGFYADRHEK